MDVKSAFLNGNLNEKVYVEHPLGLQKSKSKGLVYRLKKVLYDLKRAPCAWNQKIDAFFKGKGFSRWSVDPDYYKQDGLVTFILVYANDWIIIGSNPLFIKVTRKALQSNLEMTDMDLLYFLLGLGIWKDSKGLCILQKREVRDLLGAIGMKDGPQPKTLGSW